MNNGILEGIKVVDLSRYISGPNACSLLGNLGADVIKVESPDGEPVREYRAGAQGRELLLYGLQPQQTRRNAQHTHRQG